MAVEVTVAIIKPDAVENGNIGEIISKIERRGICIKKLHMLHMTWGQASEFYAEHAGRPYFLDLIKFIASGPIVAMLLEGDDVIVRWRKLMGATDSSQADPGTIRWLCGDRTVIRRNAVHGSDSAEASKREAALLFSEEGLSLTEGWDA